MFILSGFEFLVLKATLELQMSVCQFREWRVEWRFEWKVEWRVKWRVEC